jgi:hypothetical protein
LVQTQAPTLQQFLNSLAYAKQVKERAQGPAPMQYQPPAAPQPPGGPTQPTPQPAPQQPTPQQAPPPTAVPMPGGTAPNQIPNDQLINERRKAEASGDREAVKRIDALINERLYSL